MPLEIVSFSWPIEDVEWVLDSCTGGVLGGRKCSESECLLPQFLSPAAELLLRLETAGTRTNFILCKLFKSTKEVMGLVVNLRFFMGEEGECFLWYIDFVFTSRLILDQEESPS